MATTTVELQPLESDVIGSTHRQQQVLDNSSEPQTSSNEFSSLPPVDTGKEAWLFLAACWGVEAVTFGE
jgi:hypothetical protein